jgi:hypothetical protein
VMAGWQQRVKPIVGWSTAQKQPLSTVTPGHTTQSDVIAQSPLTAPSVSAATNAVSIRINMCCG